MRSHHPPWPPTTGAGQLATAAVVVVDGLAGLVVVDAVVEVAERGFHTVEAGDV